MSPKEKTQMRHLFWRLAQVLLVAVLLAFGLPALIFVLVSPRYEQSYQASALDKMQRLQVLESPKIILVGNSNLAFGIDSALLEEETGMPVVNLGLHISLSNAFHEQMAKQNIGPGDIVVVAHTTYADNDKIQDCLLAWATLENHYELWPILRWKDVPDMLRALPDYDARCVRFFVTGTEYQPPDNSYTRSAFNSYGDNIYPRNEPDFDTENVRTFVPGISDACVGRLRELNDYCEERGASLVIAAYPVLLNAYTPAPEEYAVFRTELASRVGCPVISDFKDYFFEGSMFYNSEYHLTNEGARVRTLQLAKDLGAYRKAL